MVCLPYQILNMGLHDDLFCTYRLIIFIIPAQVGLTCIHVSTTIFPLFLRPHVTFESSLNNNELSSPLRYSSEPYCMMLKSRNKKKP